MNETPTAVLDQAAFQRVWRRVMPQDRPDCPFTLDPPSLPAVPPPQPLVRSPLPNPQTAPRSVPCLGEASTGELPTLERLMELLFQARRAYGALERRSGRRGLFSTLAAAKARQLRRLSAAYFLISGKDHTPASAEAVSLPKTNSLALRERFRAEQLEAATLLDAAQTTADPCLAQLCRELADEDREHADRIRSRLEQR